MERYNENANCYFAHDAGMVKQFGERVTVYTLRPPLHVYDKHEDTMYDMIGG